MDIGLGKKKLRMGKLKKTIWKTINKKPLFKQNMIFINQHLRIGEKRFVKKAKNKKVKVKKDKKLS